MIRFLLNQQPVVLEHVDPNMTVLNWLRQTRRRHGTKEGCASGDCGACTVAVGSLCDGTLRYQSANSCLLLVGQLAGKQLLTVEDLAHHGQLHPVQQTLAQCDATQCGFCTPGIVMSAFTMQKSADTACRHTVEQHLGGNLCRCTGYRPIIDGGLQLLNTPVEDRFTAEAAGVVTRLRDWQQDEHLSDIAFPVSLDELAELYLARPQARLLAGGTDLNLQLTQGHQPHEMLIGLQRVEALRVVHLSGKRLEIGAMTSLSDCQTALRPVIPAFSEMLERFASQQIRNQGTLGGNLANASPVGDCAPALLAMDAVLILRRGSQQRQLPLSAFFTGRRQTALQAGEFIQQIVIEDVTLSRNIRLWKVAKRREDDISSVFAAINLREQDGAIADARVAFGGMAATPVRARACEAALQGRPLNKASIEAACLALADEFTPLSDLRASAQYRQQVAQNLLRRYLLSRVYPDAVEVSDYVR